MTRKDWEVHHIKSKIISDENMVQLFNELSVMDKVERLNVIYVNEILHILQKLAMSEDVAIADIHTKKEGMSFVVLKAVYYQIIEYNPRRLKLLKLKDKIK